MPESNGQNGKSIISLDEASKEAGKSLAQKMVTEAYNRLSVRVREDYSSQLKSPAQKYLDWELGMDLERLEKKEIPLDAIKKYCDALDMVTGTEVHAKIRHDMRASFGGLEEWEIEQGKPQWQVRLAEIMGPYYDKKKT